MSALRLTLCCLLLTALSCSARPNMPPGFLVGSAERPPTSRRIDLPKYLQDIQEAVSKAAKEANEHAKQHLAAIKQKHMEMIRRHFLHTLAPIPYIKDRLDTLYPQLNLRPNGVPTQHGVVTSYRPPTPSQVTPQPCKGDIFNCFHFLQPLTVRPTSGNLPWSKKPCKSNDKKPLASKPTGTINNPLQETTVYSPSDILQPAKNTSVLDSQAYKPIHHSATTVGPTSGLTLPHFTLPEKLFNMALSSTTQKTIESTVDDLRKNSSILENEIFKPETNVESGELPDVSSTLTPKVEQDLVDNVKPEYTTISSYKFDAVTENGVHGIFTTQKSFDESTISTTFKVDKELTTESIDSRETRKVTTEFRESSGATTYEIITPTEESEIISTLRASNVNSTEEGIHQSEWTTPIDMDNIKSIEQETDGAILFITETSAPLHTVFKNGKDNLFTTERLTTDSFKTEGPTIVETIKNEDNQKHAFTTSTDVNTYKIATTDLEMLSTLRTSDEGNTYKESKQGQPTENTIEVDSTNNSIKQIDDAITFVTETLAPTLKQGAFETLVPEYTTMKSYETDTAAAKGFTTQNSLDVITIVTAFKTDEILTTDPIGEENVNISTNAFTISSGTRPYKSPYPEEVENISTFRADEEETSKVETTENIIQEKNTYRVSELGINNDPDSSTLSGTEPSDLKHEQTTDETSFTEPTTIDSNARGTVAANGLNGLFPIQNLLDAITTSFTKQETDNAIFFVTENIIDGANFQSPTNKDSKSNTEQTSVAYESHGNPLMPFENEFEEQITTDHNQYSEKDLPVTSTETINQKLFQLTTQYEVNKAEFVNNNSNFKSTVKLGFDENTSTTEAYSGSTQIYSAQPTTISGFRKDGNIDITTEYTPDDFKDYNATESDIFTDVPYSLKLDEITDSTTVAAKQEVSTTYQSSAGKFMGTTMKDDSILDTTTLLYSSEKSSSQLDSDSTVRNIEPIVQTEINFSYTDENIANENKDFLESTTFVSYISKQKADETDTFINPPTSKEPITLEAVKGVSNISEVIENGNSTSKEGVDQESVEFAPENSNNKTPQTEDITTVTSDTLVQIRNQQNSSFDESLQTTTHFREDLESSTLPFFKSSDELVTNDVGIDFTTESHVDEELAEFDLRASGMTGKPTNYQDGVLKFTTELESKTELPVEENYKTTTRAPSHYSSVLQQAITGLGDEPKLSGILPFSPVQAIRKCFGIVNCLISKDGNKVPIEGRVQSDDTHIEAKITKKHNLDVTNISLSSKNNITSALSSSRIKKEKRANSETTSIKGPELLELLPMVREGYRNNAFNEDDKKIIRSIFGDMGNPVVERIVEEQKEIRGELPLKDASKQMETLTKEVSYDSLDYEEVSLEENVQLKRSTTTQRIRTTPRQTLNNREDRSSLEPTTSEHRRGRRSTAPFSEAAAILSLLAERGDVQLDAPDDEDDDYYEYYEDEGVDNDALDDNVEHEDYEEPSFVELIKLARRHSQRKPRQGS